MREVIVEEGIERHFVDVIVIEPGPFIVQQNAAQPVTVLGERDGIDSAAPFASDWHEA